MTPDEALIRCLRIALDDYVKHRDPSTLTPAQIGRAAQWVWVDNARQVALTYRRPFTAWMLGRFLKTLKRMPPP